MQAFMYVWLHACTFVCVCMYVSMYVCMCVYVCVCMTGTWKSKRSNKWGVSLIAVASHAHHGSLLMHDSKTQGERRGSTCTHTLKQQIHKPIHPPTCTHVHTYIHTHTRAHMHLRVQSSKTRGKRREHNAYNVCMSVTCTVCMSVMCECICVRTYVNVWPMIAKQQDPRCKMRICWYTHTFIHMYIHTLTHTQPCDCEAQDFRRQTRTCCYTCVHTYVYI